MQLGAGPVTIARLRELEIVTAAGSIFAEPGEPLTVGRHSSSWLRIDDPLVSREHLRVYAVDGSWVVEDVGSSNGTFVDGQRLERFRVDVETTVRLGHPENGPGLRLPPPAA